ncbi:hypothetical protein EP7_002291 [Isosphaeraceae bacterium EP7]
MKRADLARDSPRKLKPRGKRIRAKYEPGAPPLSVTPFDLTRLKTYPLAERRSLTRVDAILVDPDSTPAPCTAAVEAQVDACAAAIKAAKQRGATVSLIYGAHLLRNGAAPILERLMAGGWLTHLATNGAGTIHDWEYAWLGASTESVEHGVANGLFGTWQETSNAIHLALMAGALENFGYGQSLGRLIHEDGVNLPSATDLSDLIADQPSHPLTAARADLLTSMTAQGWPSGRNAIEHRWKHASILAQAYRHGIAMTVHPGIGYDIIANHPVFSGSAIGRAGGLDFRLFTGAMQALDGGVVLSVGSAIMGPQVFEKALSCVNNLRLQEEKPVVRDHSFYVVDLQDGGGWDWTQGEPPKTNPAYYLRFCKSYSRMGGALNYVQSDNLAFIHHLYRRLADQ